MTTEQYGHERPKPTICHECGGVVASTVAYHPWLFCELVKLGHSDPPAYLASYGFRREENHG